MPQRGHGSPSRPCTLGNLLVSSALWRRAEPAYMAVYNNFLKLETFNRFAHLPGITGLMERLIEAVVFPHPTKMGRIVFPQNTANSTPPHPGLRSHSGRHRDVHLLDAIGRLPNRARRTYHPGRLSPSRRLRLSRCPR